jgi:hypothetical protein
MTSNRALLFLPDSPQGKQIFNPHELRATLTEGTKDFDLPASAAANLVITPTADSGSGGTGK